MEVKTNTTLCYEYKYKSIYSDTIKRVCLQAAKNETSPEYYKTGKKG